MRCAVVTVSDSRTDDDDTSGSLIREMLTDRGHTVVHQAIIPDDVVAIRTEVEKLCAAPVSASARDDCRIVDAVIVTGGTGIARRDGTYEAVTPLLDKQLEGFGEIFRALSFAQIGAPAMLSRAMGGICNRTAVFLLPGSPRAVSLALEELILPTLGHIVALVRDQ